MQTVIGREIGYRPTSADFDGYYSPATCLLAAGPTQADIDALAARYSTWEWSGEDSVRDFAPERLVSTEAGQFPVLIRYGVGNVPAYPS